MKRWKLTIEYDGTGLCGWQRQQGVLSVQQLMEEAITKFSGEEAPLFVAGRTDAGVHARGQVAHVDLEKDVSGTTVRNAINYYLKPHRVAVLDAEEVAPDFHARFDAVSRTYRYHIVNRSAPLTLMANQAWHIPKTLQIDPMREAAKKLIGKHDFSTFRAYHCQANSPIRTLDFLGVAQEGELITITARARSFLYHQVRNMVGTLSLVGTGAWTMADFVAAFAAADRTKGGPTAPPQGLCFWQVDYDAS